MKYVTLALLSAVVLLAQETRSTINGRVYDTLNAAVSGVKVVLLNTDTNATVTLTTNDTGFYEAPLLIPGNYRITAELAGFKTARRDGVTLQVGQQVAIDVKLDVGALTETVQVTAEAPVIDAGAIDPGALIDNQQLMDLPNMGNNPTLLVKLMPGVQTDGNNNYLGLHSIAGGSAYNNAGGVGGNEWSIDGVPNNGGGRQAAYLPYSDAVAEFRIDTTGFDVSQGRGTGLSVMAMTKAGSNQYHGTMTEQHWQQRYNGTPYFTRQLYQKNIKDALASGDTALAERLKKSEQQPSGHSNNYAMTIGGPVVLPKIYNGKNKLFSFLSFNGFKDVKTEDPSTFNKTVPTMANRQGDFSALLAIDSTRYQIYDPLTVRRDPTRTGTHYIRDPMPGNIIGKSRFINPMYDFYSKLYPVPNNDPTDPRQEPRNNYLAVATPYNWDYLALQHRVDFNYLVRHRFFGRWSWNNFDEDRSDWTYSTVRGMNMNGLNRQNLAATVDWTWTVNSRTLLNVSAAANAFRAGNRQPVPMSYKPSDVGLPKYVDEWAGDQHMLPQAAISGYTASSPSGAPSFTRYPVYSLQGNISHLRGKHSLKAGADMRHHFRTGGGGGNTSGNISFDNRYTKKYEDNFVVPGDIGLSWASFIMGLPYQSTITAGNATYATYSPYYGSYVQDQFRVSRRLTLNLGFRLEWEGGPTERYNRSIGWFDPSVKIFVTDVAEAFYASRVALTELPADKFKARGGTTLPGVTAPRNFWQGQLMFMPRFAFAYAISKKTVIRGGAGTFFDMLNVTNNTPTQTGFNRTTTASTESNAGSIWNSGNPAAGISPVVDPFPVRANGTRFDNSTDGALGYDTLTGRSVTYPDYDTKRAHQHRWRLGIQHQLGSASVVSLTYAGSYARDVYVNSDINPLAGEYWWKGPVRNSAFTSRLTGGVANPFQITNFPGLDKTNPELYADMTGQTFFRNTTISRGQLLKPFPAMAGLVVAMSPIGQTRTNGIEATFSRRFSKGFNLNVFYTGTKASNADFVPNAFDRRPAWRPSNSARPHRLTSTGIYQLPFGKRRTFFNNNGVLARVVGGMQLSGTFEWQAGALLDWGNIYYYGDLNKIKIDNPTLERYFNTTGTPCSGTPGTDTGFDLCSNRSPDTYHTRQFPSRIAGLRKPYTRQVNANVQKEIPLPFKKNEQVKLFLRFDMLNVFNRHLFDGPNVTPTNTNFGITTTQLSAVNRFLQFQGRIQF